MFRTKNEMKKIPSSFVKRPKTVYFSPNLNEAPQPLPIEELEAITNITWSENNLIEESDFEALQNKTSPRELSASSHSQISKEIKKYRDSLAITHIAESVGYGVIARKEIPAQVTIASYTGVVHFQKNDEKISLKNQGSYAFIVKEKNRSLFFNAEHYRNLGAYFMHLPEHQTDYTIKDGVKFAVMNLKLNLIYHLGYPHLIIQTTRAIHEGEPLGFDYGNNYWLSNNIAPCLFTLKGEIIPSMSYYRENIEIRIKIEEGELCTDIIRSQLENHYAAGATFFSIKSPEGATWALPFDTILQTIHDNPHATAIRFNHAIPLDTSPEKMMPYEEKKTPAPKQSLLSSPRFHFHTESKAKKICFELNRISKNLNLNSAWSYASEKDLAYLYTADQESLDLLQKHFKMHQIKTQLGKHPKTKATSLCILKPSIPALEKIESLNGLAMENATKFAFSRT